MAQCGPGSTNINTKRRKKKSSRDKGKNCKLHFFGESIELFWDQFSDMGKVEFLAGQSCDICEEADKIEQMMQVDILASYRMTAYAPVF